MNVAAERKLTILNTALNLVRNMGFESLSIASLAKEVGMSKSGLFAHFNSKEKMHLMILDHAAYTFGNDVFKKSLKSKRGLPRLKLIVHNWVRWYKTGEGGTCPFLAAAVEYDAKPGPVKDRLQLHTNTLIATLNKSIELCIEQGHFKPKIDTKKVTFELYSIIIGHLVYIRTMELKSANKIFQASLDDLIKRNSA
ncbi:MAG: TetR/AcrR family transcriptional regulator [Halobacteriovoraceae bacterium]|jgi:AcrR family transcriptional regulator|nr:TetR/AcrR family transcriptional regulator [Halobacteriovoraceae bacterium]